MDILFDIITFPFELLGSGIECMFTCLFLLVLAACCGGTIAILMATGTL